jgi:hypothetical protein
MHHFILTLQSSATVRCVDMRVALESCSRDTTIHSRVPLSPVVIDTARGQVGLASPALTSYVPSRLQSLLQLLCGLELRRDLAEYNELRHAHLAHTYFESQPSIHQICQCRRLCGGFTYTFVVPDTGSIGFDIGRNECAGGFPEDVRL